MKYFEEDITSSHLEDNTIDQANSKYQLISTCFGVLIMALTIVIGLLIYNGLREIDDSFLKDFDAIAFMAIFLSGIILIIGLYILLHYLFYKLLIKRKPKIVFQSMVLTSTVPDIYVYKKTFIIINLVPYIIELLLLLIPLFFIEDSLIYLIVLILLGFTLGAFLGCIYPVLLLMFKYDKNTLIKDLGYKQIFYKLVKNNE